MIRKAKLQDIEEVEKSYVELLLHEKEHGAYTVWKLGVYPTRSTAEKGLADGSLYVMEQEGEICASMLIDQVQPEEYRDISWKYCAKEEEVLVVHLLCVRPSRAGRGIGKEMIAFAAEEGKRRKCRAIRLDTGQQNKPAASLYGKMGFELAGTSSMAIGGLISHKNHLFFEKALLSEQMKERAYDEGRGTSA